MGLVAALTLALVAGAASAGDCDVPFGLKARPDGPATEVGLGVLLLGLQSVKDADQVFEADVAVVTSWKDPRLSAVALGRSLADCRLEPGRIWNPQVQILNRIGGDTPLDEILVDEEGAVLHRRRFVGAFGARMALHDFPFDRQELSLALLSTHSPDEVVFRMDEERVGTLADLEGRGWERVGGGSRFEPTPQKLGRHGRTLAGATVSFGIARRSGFYVWKLMLPLTMIVFMAWGVFWLDPSHLSTQVGLSTSAALTFVAFQLGLGELLPPIDYLTRADRFILGCQALIFLALAEAIAASRLALSDRHELAERMDRRCRVAYPVAYLLVVFLSFWI